MVENEKDIGIFAYGFYNAFFGFCFRHSSKRCGTQAKPQVLWKWGNDFEQAENTSMSTFEDCFIVPSKSGFYNCFDTTTGKLRWSFQKNGEELKSPHKNGDKFILPGSKTNACVDSSGKQIWEIELLNPTSIVLDSKRFFVFHSRPNWRGGALSCLDFSDGYLIWEKLIVGFSLGDSANFINGRLFYSLNWGSNIVCINADNGSVLWKTDAGYDRNLSSGLVVGDDYVVFKTRQRDHEVMGGFRFCSYENSADVIRLVCLDAKTGIVRWSKDMADDTYIVAIRIIGKNIYLEAGNHTTVLEAFSGKIVSDTENGDYIYKINKAPGLTNIYQFKKDKLNVIDPSNCKVIKSKVTGELYDLKIFDFGEHIIVVAGGVRGINDLICLKSSNLDILFQTKIFGQADDAFLENKKTILALSIRNSPDWGSNYILGLSLSEADPQKQLGKRMWSLPLTGLNFKPVITKDYVFAIIGVKIFCIGKKDGLTKWEYDSESYIKTPPSVDQNSIFTNKNWATVVSIDQETGKENWSYTDQNGLQLVQMLGNGNLLIKGQNSLLSMLDWKNGKTIHKLDEMHDSDAEFIDDNTICSYYAGNVTFANIETKTISQPWLLPPVQRMFDSDANIDERVWAYWQGKLLVAVREYDRNNQVDLICYDTKTFKELWSIQINDEYPKDYNQVIDGRMLLLKDKFLSLRSLEDGKAVWQKTLDTQNPEQITINTDYIYVKDNGKVHCLSTETGKTMWELEDKSTTTQAGSYQDELVLCSYGSMTFLKGNLPVKSMASFFTSFPWKQLAITATALMMLTCLYVVIRKIIKTKHERR